LKAIAPAVRQVEVPADSLLQRRFAAMFPKYVAARMTFARIVPGGWGWEGLETVAGPCAEAVLLRFAKETAMGLGVCWSEIEEISERLVDMACMQTSPREDLENRCVNLELLANVATKIPDADTDVVRSNISIFRYNMAYMQQEEAPDERFMAGVLFPSQSKLHAEFHKYAALKLTYLSLRGVEPPADYYSVNLLGEHLLARYKSDKALRCGKNGMDIYSFAEDYIRWFLTEDAPAFGKVLAEKSATVASQIDVLRAAAAVKDRLYREAQERAQAGVTIPAPIPDMETVRLNVSMFRRSVVYTKEDDADERFMANVLFPSQGELHAEFRSHADLLRKYSAARGDPRSSSPETSLEERLLARYKRDKELHCGKNGMDVYTFAEVYIRWFLTDNAPAFRKLLAEQSAILARNIEMLHAAQDQSYHESQEKARVGAMQISQRVLERGGMVTMQDLIEIHANMIETHNTFTEFGMGLSNNTL
jgi:hypothetical protein